ncbi:MAG TPA: outer membrane beta-barrel protein [Magnetospirillum sp.]|nr:outer membrane beta-barrel protein [Magnetospirillum sp.]
MTAPAQSPNAAGSKDKDKSLRPPADVLGEKDVDAANDAYRPSGVDLGQFLLLPKIEVDETFNDNVFARQYNAKSDFMTSIRPEAALRSRFDSHELNFLGRVERKEFARFTDDSVTEFFGQSDGRLDVNKTDSLHGLVSYSAAHEDRGSPDDVGGKEPTPVRTLTGRTGGTVGLGRLKSSLDFGAVQRAYDDVQTATGTSPNHLRDRVEYEEKLREGYEIVPGYFAVIEGATNQRVYKNSADIAGFNRDSQGWRVNGGLGVDISQVVRGDFLVGYFRQNYTDDRLSDPSGLSVKAMFNWTPSRMTLVIPSLERSVEETSVSGVSALVRTSAGLLVRHELQRNIILSNSFSYMHDQQDGGDETTNLYEDRLSVTYLFNANLYAGGELVAKHRLSNADGNGYNQHTMMARFGLQY